MRKSRSFLVAMLLVVEAISATAAAYAHHPDVLLSSFGTATVDGVIAADEWNGASRVDFLANVPANDGGGTTPATFLVMNDETNLYLALIIKRASFGGATNPVFEFDANHNGVIDEGDEGFGMSVGIFSAPNFSDFFRTTQPPCPPGSLCRPGDIDFGGTNDGTAAASNDGQFTVIEFARPLNSGDAHDFSVQAGDRLGFMLGLRLFALNPQCNTCLADTYFPSLSPTLFGDIVIAPTVTLTVEKVGTGNGTVSSNSGAIKCGPICEELYGPGSSIILTATAEPGSAFVSWTACDFVVDGLCIVGMDADRTVTATFATPLVLSRSALTEGEVGVFYSSDLTIHGGVPPYSFTVKRGPLPPGLGFGSSKISGTPTQAGNQSFTIQAADQLGASVTRNFRMKILKALHISSENLRDGTVGRQYNATLKVNGGRKPYGWSLIAGQLPAGLTFDASGKISGVPSVAGITALTFQVTDPLGGVSQKSLTLTINYYNQ